MLKNIVGRKSKNKQEVTRVSRDRQDIIVALVAQINNHKYSYS